MARKRKTYSDPSLVATKATRVPVVFGAAAGTHQDLFKIYSYALNKKAEAGVDPENEKKGGIEDDDENRYSFPGNISPEGYFYSPFYEVNLKELDDELQTLTVKRINFVPASASVESSSITFYSPEMGIFKDKDVCKVTVISPMNYNFIGGQPFCIYDAQEDITYRGHLDSFSSVTNGCELVIMTEADIVEEGLKGEAEGASGVSRYYISLLEENAPEYAEYVPSTNKLIWRAPKKMSDLSSDSPLYNMPFTNGRHYIHKNLNVYVRRQDPHAGYKLFRPSMRNPLRRFQVEGDARLDFDYIKEIIDSMVDAC